MLLDIELKYCSCNEIYLGEGEGSAGASRCCVTTYFLFWYILVLTLKNSHNQWYILVLTLRLAVSNKVT